ncbi:hypothetical protein J2S13_000510 [Oikeobacillus pervagus]|uniref:Uncharacterized protein n=1 Tax=Oikeobacillus pervagus TaxID=1325931 RepID=A0AAJ1SWZ1_9BACI|nr:hypothetical protein [Oikeobacillus pervagus]MDQ0214114.1 hypothetical protein [Oikeobacillus pervagus]
MTLASEKELRLATILYYQVYQQELPLLDYRKQDIQYIITKLQQTLNTGEDLLESQILH